MPMKT